MSTVEALLRTYADVVWEPDDCIELRRFDREGRVRRHWVTAADVPTCARALESDNALGLNIYAGVNPRPHHGAAGNDCIELSRVMYADIDHAPVYEAVERVEAAKLPEPSMIVATGGGVQSYWRFDEPCRELTWWVERQRDLRALLGSDPQVNNAERVLRLPGFLNHKYNPPVRAEIVEADPRRRYDWCDLIALIPARRVDPPPVPQSGGHHDPSDVERTIHRCLSYLSPDAAYDPWYKIGMILKRELGDAGLAIWSDWSSHGTKYRPGECERKWRSFTDRASGVGIGTLVKLARDAGMPHAATRRIDLSSIGRRLARRPRRRMRVIGSIRTGAA